MSYFRLVLIPVYLVVYFSAETDRDYAYAAAVIAVSGLTDMLDGKIAPPLQHDNGLGQADRPRRGQVHLRRDRAEHARSAIR